MGKKSSPAVFEDQTSDLDTIRIHNTYYQLFIYLINIKKVTRPQREKLITNHIYII